ncbi:OmpA family protein [Subsaximicrobium wynnwilliamsii]|uniref:OmpA family protein n=1 Tax=Subsaximicrobium wynnwilliamsii TaxID=291179 RepID=A0A5C6ZMC4_9FLAO|nr:OmpA family protein [Subsaximicrobium wynnwilliamsii]TXD85600.1 OmpA family protein [Subsaximicrobium wynnwilliamsii]TXD90952.1 OmpA family protein [Subsaximicrobium wynnwilliamsii]TXE05460.1 OmpA family protein [Subsaximicrobium wynnwilliamsii]
MLKINTTATIKAIVLSVGMLFSVGLFAQSEKSSEEKISDESIIVMTKSELNSFLSTIAEARRSQLQERESRRVKEDLAELRLKYQERPGMQTGGYNTISNQQILRELQYLNQRIDNLSSYNNKMPSMNRDNSTIIMPSNAAPSQPYPLNDRSSTTVIPTSNNKKIKQLEAQIDSLKLAEANKANLQRENSFVDSLTMMKDRIKNVRRQMDSLDRKIIDAEKFAKPEKTTEDKSYFKQQIYFDNNSETLRGDYFPYIQEMTQILIKYPETKVMLEGWASTVGKADYNKQLSMRRAEAVEKALLNNRIDASRIITSFRGEDKVSSDQYARRVDMSIIVR